MCRFPNQKIGEHPFSRSYGVILPSSFDMVLSSALVYSTCSPVSVWVRSVHREDRPPNSKFFPGSFNLVDYDKSREYKETRDYGRAGKESEGKRGPRPDHPIRSKRQAWFCSQSNFVTFVYPSDGSPFGGSLGTDSLCVD
ncbi:UNVERIFIED_CONTAM: hypothetical protein Scaly_3107600 [Sesamum calycinum]|uniref:Uncharacterized protein n=1 Tax=Sesamum calycinum TaxID=2727403 RepID=A0AAW2JLL5_9LAMI